MNSVEKKPYDQEKAAFLVTVSSTDSQMWAICITAWVRWQKRQNSWWINWILLPRDREGWDFYSLFFGEEPLLSVSKIKQLAALALTATKSIKESSVTSITSQVVALALPQPWHPRVPHPWPCSIATLTGQDTWLHTSLPFEATLPWHLRKGHRKSFSWQVWPCHRWAHVPI